MGKMFLGILLFFMVLGLAACVSSPDKLKTANVIPASTAVLAEAVTPNNSLGNNGNTSGIKIKVTVGGSVMKATLIDNVTSRSLITKFPMTITMKDLYSREMCHRFTEPLPANEEQQSGYEVGDISYWTPRHSFVVFYRQTGEVISNLQKIGRFDSSVDIFSQTGDVDVTFELPEE